MIIITVVIHIFIKFMYSVYDHTCTLSSNRNIFKISICESAEPTNLFCIIYFSLLIQSGSEVWKGSGMKPIWWSQFSSLETEMLQNAEMVNCVDMLHNIPRIGTSGSTIQSCLDTRVAVPVPGIWMGPHTKRKSGVTAFSRTRDASVHLSLTNSGTFVVFSHQ